MNGELDGLAQALLAWYRAQRRELPWRRTADPYAIWVAEIMLQQTQVRTVLPYYERFLARFPTVTALAEATLDEVLALWQGLGYYARARSLYAAARLVRERFQGRVPADPSALRSLPGVGDYTAGAILSIAFGQKEPALDANGIRVLCRLLDESGDPHQAAVRGRLRAFALALLPEERPGDLNQALMELGATICLPRAPRCASCPLASFCRARALGTQAARPAQRQRRATPQRRAVAALIQGPEGILLARRVPSGLLGGLWELPGGEVNPGEDDPEALARCLLEGLGVQAEVGAPLGSIQHAYTHFRVKVHLYRCAIQGSPQPSKAWDAWCWLTPANREFCGLTGVTAKALARLPWVGAELGL